MKKFALISAVVFTSTFALQSCRQSDEIILSPEEAATLKRVQDSSQNLRNENNVIISNSETTENPANLVDGELVPPPRK